MTIVLLVMAVFASGVVAGVPAARVSVSDATVTPATPTAGAPTTVTATVRLSGGSTSAVTVDRVELSSSDGDTVASTTNLGSLSAGETLTVPITTTFDTPGEHNLRIRASVTDADDDEETVTRPISVIVEQGVPQVTFDAPNAVTGADSPVQATVSNPTNAALRNLSVDIRSPEVGDRRVREVPVLPAGATATLNFSVQPQQSGQQQLRADISYLTPAGTIQTVDTTRLIRAKPLANDVGIRVSQSTESDQNDAGGVAGGIGGIIGGQSDLQGGGSQQDNNQQGEVAVTVSNFGNAPVDSVVVIPQTANGTVVEEIGRVIVDETLLPGTASTITVNTAQAQQIGQLRFAAAYDLAGERHTVAADFNQRASGAVDLTGVNLSVDSDGSVDLRGNLGNTGGSEVSGVVVRVTGSEYVTPEYPRQSYFVGTLGSSEFAPIELTASADVQNATEVPVRITYTVGADRIVETTMVSLPPDDEINGTGTTPGGSGVGVILSVVLAGAVVAISAVFIIRRRQ
ncbi:CARDB domain-containing protein [Haloquadratum walsbyi]|jgi:NPCBM-associated, NEW3 domain of alpha-galactosidase./CARDB.|uniref:NPCBM-associated, NEW3 domain of alpha-galactosidase n=1 Tax=Haloquadratum walsbyi J07HQW2 TaxID=1238425 RepID=U1PTH3_9EURY|nr:CARDB domain-containing protein [Haloquadratum walsbyi]ERG97102.1 MAG: NPCBM-associated, NEW3 domain of alpha-galactosidase [Haloquadratum walsbyi J07HQW2]